MRHRRFVWLLSPLLIVSAGCSGGSDEPGTAPSSDASSTTSAPEVTTTTVIKTTSDRLPKKMQRQLTEAATSVIDGWWDAAYLSDGDEPFASFTKGAARLAEKQSDVMTAEAYGDGVTAIRRTVRLDVLAVRHKPVGVTAQVRFVFRASGETPQRVSVQGDVELARFGGAWQIFGFEVIAPARPVGKEGGSK